MSKPDVTLAGQVQGLEEAGGVGTPAGADGEVDGDAVIAHRGGGVGEGERVVEFEDLGGQG